MGNSSVWPKEPQFRPYPVIIVGDFMKDLDDEHCLVGAARLVQQNMIVLLAVVANLAPTMDRARGAKGTLMELGLGYVPVVRGSSMDPDNTIEVLDYELRVPYLAREDEIIPGHRSQPLLTGILQRAEDNSIILVLNSGMTDALLLVQHDPELFKRKIKHVAIMGGVKFNNSNSNSNSHSGDADLYDDDCDRDFAVPDNAANNMFDLAAANELYRLLQDLRVPMVVTMRELSYAAQVPFKMYDALARTGHVVGVCLKNRQKPSLQQLWTSSCAAPGSPERGLLPTDRTRAWFVKVFCGNVDPPIADGNDDIWPYVHAFNLYDPANLYAAIPELQDRFFDAVTFGDQNQHKVIGLSRADHGVKDPAAFSKFMVDTEVDALRHSL